MYGAETGSNCAYRDDTISLAKQNSQMMISLAHSVAVVFPTNIDVIVVFPTNIDVIVVFPTDIDVSVVFPTNIDVTAVFPTNIDVIVVFPPTIDEISPHHLLRSTKVLAGYFLK